MTRILSRLLVRVAILAASLAWAGYVFTQTVGDPGRGERIASAVLDDPEARAEVSSPITSAVMSAAGLPPDQRIVVERQVEQLLQDPAGARSFLDPFAGSWARMLGEDDPRPAEFDLAPLLDEFDAILGDQAAGAAVASELTATTDRIPVPAVPLPRVQLDWMRGVRDTVSASVVPLALVAAGAFLAAFLMGHRARVLRRLGLWAVAAGLSWVVVPPLLVWAAHRWTPGADAVVSVGLDEATSGLLAISLVLVVGGALAFGSSYLLPGPAPQPSAIPARDDRRPPDPTPVPSPGPTYGHVGVVTPAATYRPVEPTAEIPITRVAPEAMAPPTIEQPTVVSSAASPPETVQRPADDERDALWDYYGST